MSVHTHTNVYILTHMQSQIVFSNSIFTYDGTAKSIYISTILNDEITVQYDNNNKTNAGTYEVTAKFTVSNNYNEIEDMTAILTISKATYDISSITFEDATYTYDGMEFQIEVEVDAVQTHNAERAIRSAWGPNVHVDGDNLSLG